MMFVLDDGGIRAEAVVYDEGGGTIEIKNIAVLPWFGRRGYGRALIDFICAHYAPPHHTVFVGTGDCPLTVQPSTSGADGSRLRHWTCSRPAFL